MVSNTHKFIELTGKSEIIAVIKENYSDPSRPEPSCIINRISSDFGRYLIADESLIVSNLGDFTGKGRLVL